MFNKKKLNNYLFLIVFKIFAKQGPANYYVYSQLDSVSFDLGLGNTFGDLIK